MLFRTEQSMKTKNVHKARKIEISPKMRENKIQSKGVENFFDHIVLHCKRIEAQIQRDLRSIELETIL